MARRVAIALVGLGLALRAQTVQGLIAGRVTDSRSGAAITAANISYFNRGTNVAGRATTTPGGYYAAVMLPPGQYRVRVEAPNYQAQEIQNLDLAVAGRLELNFRLRPLKDVFEAGRYKGIVLPETDLMVTFFGPDLDQSRTGRVAPSKALPGRLESTLSDVIDPRQLRELPFAGRDVYTMLVTQPGVATEAGTSRGLGLSVNGQRASSSNFLLDGLENNDSLVTGPVMALAPEFIQEYRVSTNNFSAEFGRTAGFIANAVTRAGGNEWHGLGYFNLKNDLINSNSFQRNTLGLDRLPLTEYQGGGQTGGPLVRNKLFGSFAMERFRSRGEAAETEVYLPSTSFTQFVAPDSLARRLFDQFPAVARPESTLPIAPVTFRPPAELDRWLGLARADWAAKSHRIGARYAITDLGNPQFIWTPYPDFVSGLSQRTQNVALRAESMLGGRRANEARFGWTRARIGWDRAHPEIPTLLDQRSQTKLPGSPAFYGYSNEDTTIEAGDSFLLVADAHIAKFGGGFYWRNPHGELTAGQSGLFGFQDLLDYTIDKPSLLYSPLSRTALPAFELPDYRREWKQSQFYLYAQDTWRISPRLVANYGLRYDSFGAPTTSGDVVVRLGQGATFSERIAGATLESVNSGSPLYGADRNDLQARAGLTFTPRSDGRWLIRGAYGVFQDRPFDNIWQNVRNNALMMVSLSVPAPNGGYNYLAPLTTQYNALRGQPLVSSFPDLTLIDPALRNGYVQTFFAGTQWQVRSNLTVEANGSGSLGRKLLTTDRVNRLSQDNPALPEIAWRSSQGSSNYYALQSVARWRHRWGFLQGSYTWSHAIDNQSDPLTGDFFDLQFARIGTEAETRPAAQFVVPYGSSYDRGNADFDQRHNFVFFSLWEWRGFRLSQIGALRSGFPYTVTAGDNRADLIGIAETNSSVAGGRQLLNPAAFQTPAAGAIGNTGRNAFRGPGFWNIDLSLAKTFTWRERWRYTLRADAYNVFNHANLNNPESSVTSPNFGIAVYGRRGRESGFPALAPFTEAPRVIQLLFRVEF